MWFNLLEYTYIIYQSLTKIILLDDWDELPIEQRNLLNTTK